MAKKKQKSAMEEELEAFSQGKTCTDEDAPKRIIQIIMNHARNVSNKKRRYLDDIDAEQYGIYANIEAAFDILIDDLKKEGFVNE